MNENVEYLIANLVDTALSSSHVSTIAISVFNSEHLFMVAGEVIDRLKANYLEPMPWYKEEQGEEVYRLENGLLSFMVYMDKEFNKRVKKRTYNLMDKENHVKVYISVEKEMLLHKICDDNNTTLFLDLNAVEMMEGSCVFDE